MAKYARRPEVVEAEQWFPESEIEGIRCVFGLGRIVDGGTVRPGDWIVTHPNGTRAAYRPEVFEAIYIPVEEEDD